ncbi:hypothetical protein V6N11_083359 [Hibiscus sabdariffa]|uniref:ATP phosphoribosyltransferase n=1 Tax=Hibiscus sabdariffa TaxID=183260 RepID=A0ABR2QLS3_9ROSI
MKALAEDRSKISFIVKSVQAKIRDFELAKEGRSFSSPMTDGGLIPLLVSFGEPWVRRNRVGCTRESDLLIDNSKQGVRTMSLFFHALFCVPLPIGLCCLHRNMSLLQPCFQQFTSVFMLLPSVSVSRPPSSSSVLVSRRSFTYCCSSQFERAVVNGKSDGTIAERDEIRIGLLSKGRMAADTLNLLKDCQLSVKQVNPRQYIAQIPQLSNIEVWFQRTKDIVRKLLSGDLDLGIVGFDTLSEYGRNSSLADPFSMSLFELHRVNIGGDLVFQCVLQGDENLIIVHDALEYVVCRLSLAIPKYGMFENINSLKELAQMPLWTVDRPLRVATGFTFLGPKFMNENGFKHVIFSTADGALEAAPALILTEQKVVTLMKCGSTLRENNLKEIEGGVVLETQAVLVASRKALIQRKGVLDTTHEILERFEAHLRAVGQFTA